MLILSIPAILLFLTLLAGLARKPRQTFKPAEEIRYNIKAQQQANAEDNVINITAFGDDLEDLHFAESTPKKSRTNHDEPAAKSADIRKLPDAHDLLQLPKSRLN